jgi:hypothetical protein
MAVVGHDQGRLGKLVYAVETGGGFRRVWCLVCGVVNTAKEEVSESQAQLIKGRKGI